MAYAYAKTVQLVEREAEGYGVTLSNVPLDTKVWKVHSEAIPASDLPKDSLGITVNNAGEMFEPPTSFLDFDSLGTTPGLLTAEAWKLISPNCKTVLLQQLDTRSAMLLGCLVDSYVKAYGGTSVQNGNSDVKGTASSSEGIESTSEGNASSTLQRESFDVAATAFAMFKDKPQAYGWVTGDKHMKAVTKLSAAFKAAFEDGLPGPWAEGRADDWLTEPSTSSFMPEKQFAELLAETQVALQVRKHRNTCAAHPFGCRDPQMLQQLVQLYKSMITTRHRAIRGMEHLAAAAIPHLEQVLADVLLADVLKTTMPTVPEVDI